MSESLKYLWTDAKKPEPPQTPLPENGTVVSGEVTGLLSLMETVHFSPENESELTTTLTAVAGENGIKVDSAAATDLLLNLKRANIPVVPPEKLAASFDGQCLSTTEKSNESSERGNLKSPQKSSKVLQRENQKSTEKCLDDSSETKAPSLIESDMKEKHPVNVSDGVPEKVNKTVRIQSAEIIFDGASCKIAALKPSPSVGTILDGVKVMENAWDRLKESFVYFTRKPAGKLAALAPRMADDLNCNEVLLGQQFAVPAYSKVSLLQQPINQDSDEELENADQNSGTAVESFTTTTDELNGDLTSKLSGAQCWAASEGIYVYPLETQDLFFFALRCAKHMLKTECGGKELMERIDNLITALSSHIQKYYRLEFSQLHNIYRYETEYVHTVVNKFNVIPESIPDWVLDFMTKSGGYLIGNTLGASEAEVDNIGFENLILRNRPNIQFSPYEDLEDYGGAGQNLVDHTIDDGQNHDDHTIDNNSDTAEGSTILFCKRRTSARAHLYSLSTRTFRTVESDEWVDYSLLASTPSGWLLFLQPDMKTFSYVNVLSDISEEGEETEWQEWALQPLPDDLVREPTVIQGGWKADVRGGPGQDTHSVSLLGYVVGENGEEKLTLLCTTGHDGWTISQRNESFRAITCGPVCDEEGIFFLQEGNLLRWTTYDLADSINFNMAAVLEDGVVNCMTIMDMPNDPVMFIHQYHASRDDSKIASFKVKDLLLNDDEGGGNVFVTTKHLGHLAPLFFYLTEGRKGYIRALEDELENSESGEAELENSESGEQELETSESGEEGLVDTAGEEEGLVAFAKSTGQGHLALHYQGDVNWDERFFCQDMDDGLCMCSFAWIKLPE